MLRWWILASMVLVGSCVAAPKVQAQENLRMNFELVRDAARAASGELARKMQRPEKSLALRALGSHEGSFLVENALAAELAAAGYTVHTRAESLDVVIEFEVVDLGLAYTRTWRHAWLGERRVERQARCRLFARLVDAEQASVLWADQAEAKVVDEIAQDKLGDVEEKGSAQYLQAALPPQRWNKYVEPVVVTGIVVGLIVLFFANQNTSN